jgi:hypothetical protein
MFTMDVDGIPRRKLVKGRAKHALANVLGSTVNSLGPSGYPSTQMLATYLINDKSALATKAGVIFGIGALLELAEELT